MEWLRLYSEMLDDPKIQRLPPPLFKTWINLLCLANKNETNRGELPCIEDIAFCLRISEEDATSALQTLIQKGLIENRGDGFTPRNWTKRQPESDNSAKRMREARGKQEEPEQVPNNSRTSSEHLPNKCALEQSRAESEQIRLEQSRAEAESRETAAPLVPQVPPASAFNNSASAQCPPPDFSPLSEEEVKDLVDKGGWTRSEIAMGCVKIRGRSDVLKPKSLLHTHILPEIRKGKPPPPPPRVASARGAPPVSTSGTPESVEEVKRMAAEVRQKTGIGIGRKEANNGTG